MDSNTFTIDDQFLLGSSHLIAPVVDEMKEGDSISRRDIYLPKGEWKDVTQCDLEELINGTDSCHEIIISLGEWKRNYQVKLDQCPLFILQ